MNLTFKENKTFLKIRKKYLIKHEKTLRLQCKKIFCFESRIIPCHDNHYFSVTF